jgi:2-keto-4-pentenoate hydratase/2-oxohepta-3-ene-1,7-dioic acid hydratase in catechol pathway
MEPSERVNLPAWKGQSGHYEIWFVVVLDLDARRATWVRYATFSPAEGAPHCSVYAADFDADRTPTTIVAKTRLPITEYVAAADRFEVSVGDSQIRHGHCHGHVERTHRLAWDLDFVVASAPVRRTPAVLETMKLATEAVHAAADAPATGWVEVDGVRRELRRAKVVQMHLHGTRRIDELTWIWSPALGHEQATLEVVSAHMKRGALAQLMSPRLTSVWLRHGDEIDDLTQLPDALRPKVEHPGPGIADVGWSGARRAIRVRAFAPPSTFAGWAYRNPRGKDLHVAQSDIASCVVETFSRRHPLARWQPVARLTSDRQTALELHGRDPIPGITYVAWEQAEPAITPPGSSDGGPTNQVIVRKLGSASQGAAPAAAPGGTWEPLPPPRAVFAAGLTYRAHAKETGGATDGTQPPPMFRKGADSWLPHGDKVPTPATETMLSALELVEPGLAAAVRDRYAFLPALLDYEVELGIVVLGPATRADLAAGRLPRLGWFVANDLTARACQILGEDQADPLSYWSAAKSFTGFAPVTERCWIPDRIEDRPPEVTLATRVNGGSRQDGAAADLMYAPSKLLAAAAALAGRDLDAGDVVLTGTPPGVAMQVPRWKRRLADLTLDRFGKLDAAIDMYAGGAGFLRPGDWVEVDAGFLGHRRVTIDL